VMYEGKITGFRPPTVSVTELGLLMAGATDAAAASSGGSDPAAGLADAGPGGVDPGGGDAGGGPGAGQPGSGAGEIPAAGDDDATAGTEPT
jgi:hypothetical protein